MFHVKAKETTVTIGTRVFSPAVATYFQDELPPEVAECSDLLTIEEVPDAESTVEAGGLSATGTLQTDDSEAGGAGTDATVATIGEGTASDPAILTDETLMSGVAIITVGDDDDDTGGHSQEPDPFADPTEGPGVFAGQDLGSAPKAAPSGKGGRGGRK